MGTRSRASSRRPGSPYWLIVRDPVRRGSREIEIFSLELHRGKLLLVFGSEESAERCRECITDMREVDMAATGETIAQSGWRLRSTGSGEMISLLSGSVYSAGPCAGVERIIVDPPPEVIEGFGDSEDRSPGESRRCFMERLMGRDRAWFETAGSQTAGGGAEPR